MIGNKIKELRTKKGYTITELSKLAKVSKSYLSQLERGLQRNPSLQFLYKIATPLDTTIEYLLKGERISSLEIPDLDEEWRILIKRAIDEGLVKEDFKEYINYLKFSMWLNKHKE